MYVFNRQEGGDDLPKLAAGRPRASDPSGGFRIEQSGENWKEMLRTSGRHIPEGPQTLVQPQALKGRFASSRWILGPATIQR